MRFLDFARNDKSRTNPRKLSNSSTKKAKIMDESRETPDSSTKKAKIMDESRYTANSAAKSDHK